MAVGFQIRCANKNIEGLIVRLSGEGWTMSHQEAVTAILSRSLRMNILIGNESFDIGVRGEGKDAYLVLEPDGKSLSQVENLPSC